jgi:hypothetical protein
LEQTTGVIVHAQNENAEQETRRVEALRLLAEAERVFHEHGKNPTIQVLGPPTITPVIHMGEGELTPPRDTSPEGNNEQPVVEQVQVEKSGPGLTTEPLTVTPGPSALAPVIADLITIYDDESEDLDNTIVPIINEAATKILDTQLPQGPQPMDMGTNLNTTESITTPLGQGSQPQAEGESGQERKEEEHDTGDATSVGKGETQDKE